jgi:hypothetical protein
MHVDLSGGQSAELIPLGQIRHRKIVAWKTYLGSQLDGLEEGDYEAKATADEQYKAYVLAGLITSWTLQDDDGKPLPIAADSMLDLFAVDYAALVKAADPVFALVAGRPVDPKSRRSSAA